MAANDHGGAWATWVAFAGIMMITLGIFDVLGGVAALFSDDYFAVTKDGLLVENYKVIGVVHLCFGVLLICVGWALLQLGNGRASSRSCSWSPTRRSTSPCSTPSRSGR